MKNKILSLIATVLSCIFAGISIGIITNAVNGAVSPLYFKNIMRWHHINNIWRASIAEGAFEGIIFGTIFAILFTAIIIYSMKSNFSYSYALKWIANISIAIIACWIMGGIVAMVLASFSPEFYRYKFIGVPEEFGAMLKYAWVGGSIWGVLIGGIFSSIFSTVLLLNKRKNHQ